jgi:hypothetical protein
MAFHLAHWVQAWHDAEDRDLLQVKTRPPQFLPIPDLSEPDWQEEVMTEVASDGV